MAGPAYHGPSNAAGGSLQSRLIGRAEVVHARPELADDWQALDAAFPVRIPRSFWERLDPTDPTDPLTIQALPDPRELVPDPHDIDDPVGDIAQSPMPWVVRKHADRLLLLLTKRCHLDCRYCFRRTHSPGGEDPTPDQWRNMLDYAASAGVEEVILSGGDPLALRDDRLFEAIDALRPTVPVIRVHSRAPITAPFRVTDALVAGLKARGPVWLVVHTNHPRELSPEVDEALQKLVDAGIPVLNQSVLLRGVNDDPDVLAELSRQLVRRRVFPYYLHHPDAVPGNAHLRVSVAEGLAIVEGLRRRVSGIALPTYVIDPPDGSGKLQLRPPP